MRGRDDDAAAGSFHRHRKFGGRRGSQSDVDHIEPHAHQRATHHILDHLAGNACIPSHHDGIALHRSRPANPCGVCRCKLHNVQRIQRVTHVAANSSAYA